MSSWATIGRHSPLGRHTSPEDLYFVSDLHAMTNAHNPARLRALNQGDAGGAAGCRIDPDLVFVSPI